MSDLEEARALFQESGLAFPEIPAKLAVRLKKRGKWLYATRTIRIWPYRIDEYVGEASKPSLRDYALLAHSGHGVNSYALQYYLVRGGLRLFLHLGWGGAYMDPVESTAQVSKCFALADQIVVAAESSPRILRSDPLVVACSEFYGSCWSKGEVRFDSDRRDVAPAQVLCEVLEWLQATDNYFAT